VGLIKRNKSMGTKEYSSLPNTSVGQELKAEEKKAHIKPCTVILVEDDQDDRLLAIHKFKKSELIKDVVAVSDGTKLVAYMRHEGYYDHSIIRYNPMVIVIDLKMPNMNGFDIL
jgi:response regulator RpfG family c-di-GMP phosphodiesterase